MASIREIDRIRKASGDFRTDVRLVAFLYLLARDGLPIGSIENLLDRVSDDAGGAPSDWSLTNGWLGKWAEDAAGRLREPVVDEATMLDESVATGEV